MKEKKTLVLGASDNPSRYSYLALKRLQAHQYPVVAIGKRKTIVDNAEIDTDKIAWKEIDTVTIYLNPVRQPEYYQYILSLKPRRIIFNPGAENQEFSILAENNNIQVVNACTLVLLSTGQY